MRRLAVRTAFAAPFLALAACYDVAEPSSRAAMRALNVPETIRADGVTLTTVSASIDANVPTALRPVTFATTAGKFPGNGTASITVTPDASGTATTLLLSPTDPGTAVVSAAAGGGFISKTISFTPVPSALVALAIPHSATADGATILELSADVDPSARGAQRTVAFTTTAGKFVGSASPLATQATANSAGRATAQLQVPSDPALAIVSATAGSTTLADTIRFVMARPASIQLTPSAFSLKAAPGAELTLTAIVRRAAGTPLAGIPVKFTATDTTDQRRTVGFLTTPIPSDANGAVTIKLALQDTSYIGQVLIQAMTATPEALIDSTKVVIVR